jgi:hypothetical protein
MDRRSFFSNMMAVAAFSGILGEVVSPKEIMAAVEEAADVPNGQHQQFWNGFFDDVDPTKPHATMTRGPGGEPTPQPVPEHVQDEKLPRFFHYDDSSGLRFADRIEREELPRMDGAAVVSLSIGGFHSSEGDAKKIGDASSAQLQLHATQTTPMAQYIAPLAWASLASIFYSKSTKLPTVDQLNFVDSGGSAGDTGGNRILLPKAEGKLALNLTLPERHALLHKIISYGLQGASIAAPLVSLPAISVPAIKAFTSFYNILVQNAGFIINSPLKDVVASYDAVDSGNMHADALKLMTGSYIIVPASSTSTLSARMSDLKLINGYLVPKTIAANEDPEVVAKNALSDVTYATIKVSVQPAADVTVPDPGRSRSSASGGGGGGGSDSSSSSTASKSSSKSGSGSGSGSGSKTGSSSGSGSGSKNGSSSGSTSGTSSSSGSTSKSTTGSSTTGSTTSGTKTTGTSSSTGTSTTTPDPTPTTPAPK